MTREEARADLMLAQADISYRPKDDSIDMAIEALKNQKTGYWINVDYGYYECSECGRIEMGNPNYCQYCGAKMEGEKNDTTN